MLDTEVRRQVCVQRACNRFCQPEREDGNGRCDCLVMTEVEHQRLDWGHIPEAARASEQNSVCGIEHPDASYAASKST